MTYSEGFSTLNPQTAAKSLEKLKKRHCKFLNWVKSSGKTDNILFSLIYVLVIFWCSFNSGPDIEAAIAGNLSCCYHVWEERRGIQAYLLDDVEVDDTLGSSSHLSSKNWFKKALDQYSADQCIDLFRVHCICRKFMTEDRVVMISSHKCSTAAVRSTNMASESTCSAVIELRYLLPSSPHKPNPKQYMLRPTTPCGELCSHSQLQQLWVLPMHHRSTLRPEYRVRAMLTNCSSDSVCQTTHGRSRTSLKNVPGIKAELCQTHTLDRHCRQQWNSSKILQRWREMREVRRDAFWLYITTTRAWKPTRWDRHPVLGMCQ